MIDNIKVIIKVILAIITVVVVAIHEISLYRKSNELSKLYIENSELSVKLATLEANLHQQNILVARYKLEQSQSTEIYHSEIERINMQYKKQIESIKLAPLTTCDEQLSHIKRSQEEYLR